MKKLLLEIKRGSALFLCLSAAVVLAFLPSKSLGDDTNQAAEVVPPPPAHYFNDYASVVSPATASWLDAILAEHERQSSDQIVVAVFPKMQSTAPIKDYTQRVANAWRVGQQGKRNGVALFLFVQDHKMYVQVGMGLEKALPDATCKKILDTKIIPNLKKGDFDGGLTAGVTAFIEATKGAYQGNGKTAVETTNSDTNAVTPAVKNSLP